MQQMVHQTKQQENTTNPFQATNQTKTSDNNGRKPHRTHRQSHATRNHSRPTTEHDGTPRITKLIELRNWGATKQSLRLIYLTLIRPIMETGYHLGIHVPKYMKKLQIIQNKCLRTIVWAPYREPSEPLHHLLRVPPIEEYLANRHEKALQRYQGSSLQESINTAISLM